MKDKYYYSMTTSELKMKLKTDENGLSTAEAKRRVNKYGLNELPKKKKDSLLKIFVSELLDPIILLLLVAIVASLIVGEYIDALAITLIILVDLIIGVVE